MALITCVHCGKTISDTAENCIHCGKSLKVQETLNSKSDKPKEKKDFYKIEESERQVLYDEFKKEYKSISNQMEKEAKVHKTLLTLAFVSFLAVFIDFVFIFTFGKNLLDVPEPETFAFVINFAPLGVFFIAFFALLIVIKFKSKEYKKTEFVFLKAYKKWLNEVKSIDYMPMFDNMSEEKEFEELDITDLDLK